MDTRSLRRDNYNIKQEETKRKTNSLIFIVFVRLRSLKVNWGQRQKIKKKICKDCMCTQCLFIKTETFTIYFSFFFAVNSLSLCKHFDIPEECEYFNCALLPNAYKNKHKHTITDDNLISTDLCRFFFFLYFCTCVWSFFSFACCGLSH